MVNLPQISDNDDAMVELLTIIAQNTGGLGDLSTGDEDSPRPNGVRIMNPGGWFVRETAHLDESTEDGTVVIEPGESATIVEHRVSTGSTAFVLSIGAVDEEDVQYALRIDDNNITGGWTNSPLGLLNDPFSFAKHYGALLPATRTVEYLARADPDAAGPVEIVGRLHLEEI